MEDLAARVAAAGEIHERRTTEAEPDDRSAALRDWADRELSGKQRAVLLAVIDAGGVLALRTLAAESGVNWNAPWDDAWNRVRGHLNRKMQRAELGWELVRRDSCARLVPSGPAGLTRQGRGIGQI